MHRVAVGDPQCVSHELFAEFRIRMVDGEAVRQKFYPRGCASFYLVVAAIAVEIVRSGAVFHLEVSRRRARPARGSAMRRRSFAVAVRCNFDDGREFFFGLIATDAPAMAGRRAYRLRDDERMPVICPTCQIVFANLHAGAPATFHGVVFDIFGTHLQRGFFKRHPRPCRALVFRSVPLIESPGIDRQPHLRRASAAASACADRRRSATFSDRRSSGRFPLLHLLRARLRQISIKTIQPGGL